MDFNLDKIKRAIRLQYPPDFHTDAGSTLGSRTFEALPAITPVVTYSFILLSAVLFFFTDIETNGDPTLKHLALERLGHRNDFNILLQDWWALATNALFHGNSLHIIMNCLWMLGLGTLMERGLGSFKTLLLFITFAMVSTGYQVLVNSLHLFLITPSEIWNIGQVFKVIPFHSSLGLSGIVYGIVGFMWGSWKRWTGFLVLFNKRMLNFMLMWQGVCFILTYTGTMPIANTAHISGLIIGFLIGITMCYGLKLAKLWLILLTCMTSGLCAALIYYHFQISETVEPFRKTLENNRVIITTPLFQ